MPRLILELLRLFQARDDRIQEVPAGFGVRKHQNLRLTFCGTVAEPKVANDLGRQKVNNLLNTGAQLIASPNPGCSLQIKKHMKLQGKEISLLHPMELLDYSIRGIKLKIQGNRQ